MIDYSIQMMKNQLILQIKENPAKYADLLVEVSSFLFRLRDANSSINSLTLKKEKDLAFETVVISRDEYHRFQRLEKLAQEAECLIYEK